MSLRQDWLDSVLT